MMILINIVTLVRYSFDICGTFSLLLGKFGKNVVTFGADISSSANIDNKKRYLNS